MSLLLWTMTPARVWRRMHGQGCIFRCFKCLFLLHLRHKTFPYVWILICLSVLWLASILLPLISQCLWWILKWFKRSVLTALQTLLQLCLIREGGRNYLQHQFWVTQSLLTVGSHWAIDILSSLWLLPVKGSIWWEQVSL